MYNFPKKKSLCLTRLSRTSMELLMSDGTKLIDISRTLAKNSISCPARSENVTFKISRGMNC